MTGSQGHLSNTLRTDQDGYIVVAKIRRPHGVQGEMLVDIHPGFPYVIHPKQTIFLGERHIPTIVITVRSHHRGLLLRLSGIKSPEEAGNYRNQNLSIAVSDLQKLPNGHNYTHELIGMQVEDLKGNILGKLKEILITRANDVYVITSSSGKEILLPAIPEVVKDVDLENMVMKVELLPGLIDDK